PEIYPRPQPVILRIALDQRDPSIHELLGQSLVASVVAEDERGGELAQLRLGGLASELSRSRPSRLRAARAASRDTVYFAVYAAILRLMASFLCACVITFRSSAPIALASLLSPERRSLPKAIIARSSS